MSARFTVADLAASGVLEHGRNRSIVAEAAGLPVQAREHESTLARKHETNPGRGGPSSTTGHADAQRPHPLAGGPNPGGADLRALTFAVLGEQGRVPPLEGEDATQADLKWWLDQGCFAGKWLIVSVMVYNEVRVRTASKGELSANPGLLPWHERQERAAKLEGARTRAMGRRKGCPDLFLINVDPSFPRPAFGLLEVKVPPNRLSDEQETWQDWCEAAGVNWGLVESPRQRDDALRALQVWGWL